MKELSRYALLISFFVTSSFVWSQSASPVISFYSVDDESEVEMTEGESQTAQAPLELTCKSNISDADGYNYTCEWRFFKSQIGEESPVLTRFEENTSYTLTESGSYGVKLYVTFTDGSNNTLEYESDVFTIIISESSLSCPDGFSPNGDGINDVLKIDYQSIVKLEASIFNRWGKKLYSMDLHNVDAGWDGMQGGKYVKDGVYFININAVGSDGVEYKIKKAINVLKGFNETDETGGE